MTKLKKRDQLTTIGLLISVGIVYGDIGISLLYVTKSVVAGNGGVTNTSCELISGATSLILWTVTLLTTIKCVVIVLRATGHGEGDVFTLYTLVRK